MCTAQLHDAELYRLASGVVFTHAMLFGSSASAAGTEQVAFTKYVDNASELWRVGEDGSNPTKLLNVPGGTRGTTISPDRQTVAWAGWTEAWENGILIAPLKGGAPKLVYSPPSGYVGDPHFSADGKWIYFDVLNDDYEYDIWRTSTNGQFTEPVITAPGDQFSPTFSSDGSKMAFIGGADPDPVDPANYRLFVATPAGADQELLDTSGVGAKDIYFASISPDGSKIVFPAEPEDCGAGDIDLWTIGTNGLGLANLTSTPQRNEYEAAWSASGRIITTSAPAEDSCQGVVDLVESLDPQNGGDRTPLESGDFVHPSARQGRDPSLVDLDDLLLRYVPVLRYNVGEQFFADSAAAITDAPANTLRDADGELIAAHGDSEHPELTLGYLGSVATGSAESDRIWETNFDPSPADAAAAVHALPGIRNRIYGRVYEDSSSGKTWLQYWFSYYFNQLNLEGFGLHQGDWEMVQVGLDDAAIPETATYAQHDDAQTCSWDGLDLAVSPDTGSVAPAVYVAQDSHASYMKPGTYARTGVPDDNANGDGESAWPSLEAKFFGSPSSGFPASPPWLGWGGFWGATDYAGSHSPRGPAFQGDGKWSDPEQFSDDAIPCDTSGLREANRASAAKHRVSRHKRRRSDRARADRRLPAPDVRAAIDGRKAVIDYAIRGGRGNSTREKALLISVDPAGSRRTARTTTHSIADRSGRIRVGLPAGHGPYRLYVATISAHDAIGRVVSVRLGHKAAKLHPLRRPRVKLPSRVQTGQPPDARRGEFLRLGRQARGKLIEQWAANLRG